MNALVGYTGFVGSNLYRSYKFDKIYNSKNIEESFGTNPDLLVYAGVRAEKYLANNNKEKDYEIILNAEDNIKKINPKKIVLISTIDVYKNPISVDENTNIDVEDLHPYGYNRYKLETWVKENFSNYLIVRLPGLYGENIKKNFIYDYINIIPFMIKKEKMEELVKDESSIINYYSLNDNGFYKLNNINDDEKKYLRNVFEKIGFTALNFTDSRAKFQFYNLSRLWDDIQVLLKNNIKLFNAATEPISASELYKFIENKEFKNEISNAPLNYDFKTIYTKLFNVNNDNGYILDKNVVLKDIKEFVFKHKK